jgi:hypothetical protein
MGSAPELEHHFDAARESKKDLSRSGSSSRPLAYLVIIAKKFKIYVLHTQFKSQDRGSKFFKVKFFHNINNHAKGLF